MLKLDGTLLCLGTNEEIIPAPDIRFQSIAAGEGHVCGIRTDGSLACWGLNYLDGEYIGLADPPAGSFTSVSAGTFHSCGIRTDGSLACWGLNHLDGKNLGLVNPPAGSFTSVSAGWLHSCGLRADGSVTCWGYDEFEAGQTSPPGQSFESVSVGGLQSCGYTTNGELVCWGSIVVGPSGDCTFFCFPETAPAQDFELPAAPFQRLPDGGRASCGIASDGSIRCWGYPFDRINPPKGEFSDVSVGGSHACGLRTDGDIVCWTLKFDAEVPGAETGLFCLADDEGFVACPGEPEFEMEAMEQSGRLIDWQVYSHNGINFRCGYRLDDSLICWNSDQSEIFDPIPKVVEAFASSDGNSVCWLLPDHTVACWGTIGSPTGTFRSISLGTTVDSQFGCGIRTDNALACWGDDSSGYSLLFPPVGEYKSVSAVARHACAIKLDATVDCWGNVSDGGSCWGEDPQDFQGCIDHTEAGDPWTPLSGTFQTISGSYCGVHAEGHIECEIGDRERRWWKIEGAFRSVGTGIWGGQYACGLHLDGTLECWGENSNGRAAPPEGEFLSISTGAQHACGVRADGTVACWGGKDTYIGGGRAAAGPPGGTFRSVSVGGRPNHGTHYSCGVRSDGAPACWGNPQSPVLQALIPKAPILEETAPTN